MSNMDTLLPVRLNIVAKMLFSSQLYGTILLERIPGT